MPFWAFNGYLLGLIGLEKSGFWPSRTLSTRPEKGSPTATYIKRHHRRRQSAGDFTAGDGESGDLAAGDGLRISLLENSPPATASRLLAPLPSGGRRFFQLQPTGAVLHHIIFFSLGFLSFFKRRRFRFDLVFASFRCIGDCFFSLSTPLP